MGNGDGPIQSFKTLGKPLVTTGAAQEPTGTTASVTGTVNPGGAATTYRVVYVSQAGYHAGKEGCTEQNECAYINGHTTSSRSLLATGYTPEAAAPITLEELEPETTYDYALGATNSTGTTIGPDQTFTTGPGPATPRGGGAPQAGGAPASRPTFTLPASLPLLPFTSIATLNAKEARENKQPIHKSKKKHTKKMHKKTKRKTKKGK
jgi:hypothetical protein